MSLSDLLDHVRSVAEKASPDSVLMCSAETALAFEAVARAALAVELSNLSELHPCLNKLFDSLTALEAQLGKKVTR